MKFLKRFVFILLAILIVLLSIVGFWFFNARSAGQTALAEPARQAAKADAISFEGKKYVYNDKLINLLFMGVDKNLDLDQRRAGGSQGLADAIFLMSYNTENKTFKMVAIPRDTEVPVVHQDTSGNKLETVKEQITLQYAYGTDPADSSKLVMEDVSELLFRLPIQKYITINMEAVPVINDEVGGVTLTTLPGASSFPAGQKWHLTGSEALNYVRQRTKEPQAALNRLERQKQYIQAFLSQAKTAVMGDLGLPFRLLDHLGNYVSTNLTSQEITYLLTDVGSFDFGSMKPLQIPGHVEERENHEFFITSKEDMKKFVLENFYTVLPSETDSQ